MLSPLLPRKIATSRLRLLWLALLLLSPLAYLGGVYLFTKTNHNAHAGLTIDRPQALARAAAYLSGKGLNVTNWERYCIAETDNELHFYYLLRPGQPDELARRMAPPLIIKALFRKPDNAENVEVQLTAAGVPIGFTRRIWHTPQEKFSLSQAEARALAEAALHARPEDALISGAPKIEEVSDKGDLTRRFIWQWNLPTRPELQAQTIVAVFGNQVIGERSEAKLADDFARQHLRSDRAFKLGSSILYGLVLAVVIIFGVYRFIKRARQKEVSYLRIFLLTFAVAVAYNSIVVLTDIALYPNAQQMEQAPPGWLIYVSAGLFWVFAALFIGLAYGSGEGDMREANPGKLTSLDALLLGKFFSRNVARAMVWGCAMGGWLLLAIQLALLVWYQRPNTGEELLPLTIFYGDFPLFTILTSWLPDVVLVMVIGLLAPWPLLQRRLRSARWQIVALACFTWVACQGPLLGQRPWLSVLAIAVLKTAFVLLAFFNFDLLTAGVVYALPSFVKFAVTIGAQPAAGFRQTGRVALGLAAAWLLVELVFAFKGRWLRAEEVRPIYARNLAERLSLQAEVSAAREAQQRLLPQSLPLSPYFTVAASCVPAREVGGDFFDFFEVGPGRLGVLVAEGGGKGLPSALSIAYAKGFLMPKIGGQTRGDDSPTEVLRGLQEQLNLMMGHDEDIGLAYLVLDTSEGVARYARIGQYPQIVLGNSVAPEEREIKFSTGANPRETISVIEGRIELGGGDGVMIFTGGLVEAWKNNKQTPSGEFTKMLTQASASASTEELQTALAASINQCLKLARKQGLGDDLTAVLIRVEPVKVLDKP